jgi:hypothetical protein
MRTSRGSTPASSTRATPSSRSMGFLKYRSSRSYCEDRSCSAEKRTESMGSSAVEAIHIHMRSADLGSCARTESSLARTSKAAVLMSVPQAKRISKRESSSLDVERISSMPGSVASASSMGRVISSSVSSGVDPG